MSGFNFLILFGPVEKPFQTNDFFVVYRRSPQLNAVLHLPVHFGLNRPRQNEDVLQSPIRKPVFYSKPSAFGLCGYFAGPREPDWRAHRLQ
jgi:hypothetical protein